MNDLGAPSSSVLPAVAPPGRVWLLSGLGAGVAIAVVLAFLLWPRGDAPSTTSTAATSSTTSAAANPSAPSPSASGSAAGSPGASHTEPHVAGVGTLSRDFATGLVTDAGITVPGEVQQAVQWTDANGRNILLAAARVDHRRGDGDADAGTITVLHVAHIEGKARLLRTMTDSGGTSAQKPCPSDFGTVVVPNSLTVRDDDGDGVGEATAAWFVGCAGDPGPSPVRLALLTGGKKFMLRGEAVPKTGPGSMSAADMKAYGIPAGSYTADPRKSDWPRNSFSRADGLFHQLFR